MNKQEFLARLRDGLGGLPQEDVEERLSFYSEMIDDRTEEGLTEEEAVAEVGTVDEVISQIVAQTPLSKLVKERVKPNRRLRTWEIALLILGFPLWFPLLIAAAAVVFSIYITIWSLIFSLWAVELSLAVSALGAVAASVLLFVQSGAAMGLLMLGAAFICAGLAIFLFFGCLAASKGIVLLTKNAVLGIKSMFVGKER